MSGEDGSHPCGSDSADPSVAKILFLEIKVIGAWPGAWTSCCVRRKRSAACFSHEGPPKSSGPDPTTGHQSRSSFGHCAHKLGSRGQGLARPPPSSASGRSELCPGTRNLSGVWKTLHQGGISQSFLNPGGHVPTPRPGAQSRAQRPP